MTASTQIFVGNFELPPGVNVEMLDGSFSMPFPDIQDALNRAYEYCADVILNCTVTILLAGSEHYLLNTERQYYKGTKIDNWS